MRNAALVAVAICTVSPALAAAPRTIPLQGLLTNAAGQPLPDGPRNVMFRLYAAPVGGAALWSESQTVSTVGGRFAATLGAATPFPDSMLFDASYFAGVSVAGDPEMSPRLPLQAVPYALSLSLPSRAVANVSGTALSITNAGAGPAIRAARTAASGTEPAVYGTTSSTDSNVVGILGEVSSTTPGGFSAAVRGTNKGIGGLGIGVYGSHAGTGWGVYGLSPGGVGVFGQSTNGQGVSGNSTNGVAISGTSFGNSAGVFSVTAANNDKPAVQVDHGGTGPGLLVKHTVAGTGNGITVVVNGSGSGVEAFAGSGFGVHGQSNGASSAGVIGDNTAGGEGVVGRTSSPAGVGAVVGRNDGVGGAGVKGFNTKNGPGGIFEARGSANPSSGVEAIAFGSGNGILVTYSGVSASSPASNNIAVFRTGNVNKARIDNTGRGFFNGGTQSSGADVAEAFAVQGERGSYEPGDVLVISTRSDRTLEKSASAYSTGVAGVYSTRPGTLLTERDAEADHSDTVPLGVIGVIPTKVTAENGAIRRGDLLVTSGTPGHAMKAGPNPPAGSVIGKALAEFAGEGSGLIRVLVNVR